MNGASVNRDRWAIVRFDDDEVTEEETAALPHLSDAEMAVLRLIAETTLDRHYSDDDMSREDQAIRSALIGAVGKLKAAIALQLPNEAGQATA
jgi:hypothetical protein